MNKKLYLSLIFSFLISTVIYGVTYKSISPKGRFEYDDSSTCVEIECNISDVEVYINGSFHGKSTLVITGLNPGFYELKLVKDGYETGYYKIQAKKGYRYYYKFEMQKEKGFVKILNWIDNASITIDGSLVDGPEFTFDTGKHSIKVRKFGFRDFSASISINVNETTKVQIDLPRAAFEVSNLKVSKKVINPAYSGGLGTTEISFNVTANGSARLYITDEYGFTVWEHVFSSFSTWENSVDWSGVSSDGYVLPDGNYTVNLEYEGGVLTKEITIDSYYSFPLQSFTFGGGGAGEVPYAMQNKGLQFMPFLFVKPAFAADEDFGYSYTQMGIGLLFDFAKHFEVGVNSSGLIGTEYNSKTGAPFSITFNTKFAWDFAAGNTKIGTAVYGRYGFSGFKFMTEVNGDNGTGLGAGLALGLEAGSFYTGLSAEYLWGAETGKVGSEYDILKTGLSLSFCPYINRKVSVWGAVSSLPGEDEFKFVSSINTGLEYLILPDGMSLLITLKAEGVINPGSTSYVSGSIALSYLF